MVLPRTLQLIVARVEDKQIDEVPELFGQFACKKRITVLGYQKNTITRRFTRNLKMHFQKGPAAPD